MKILFTLLACLFALSAPAQTTFEQFTTVDEWPAFPGPGGEPMPNIINPGEFICTGGGEPTGLFECEGGNGIHIRGTEMLSCMHSSDPHDTRLEGTMWFNINANWDVAYTGPVSGNWKLFKSPMCDPSVAYDPDNFWAGTYTGKRELVMDPVLGPTWISKLKVVGYGTGTLFGQNIKATEVITTYSPLPLPWELLPPALQAVIGTGPEGLAEITIITEY